ncbi:MAG: ABC transporter permease [Brevundimonas sp.]
MLAPLYVEIRKLNRSLALLLALAAPTLIGIFTFFNMLRGEAPQPWDMWLVGASAIWAFFMLPMSVTALTALVAHMEHGPRAWDHLRALPRPRWTIYAAKATCVLGLVALMSLLNLAISVAAVMLAGWVKPVVAASGELNVMSQFGVIGRIWLAGLLLIAIQFWIAMLFSSFVPALAVGIGGTFFSVVATSARAGVFFPWQMPVNMLATEAWRVQTALGLGAGLGAVALVIAVAHLSMREAR